VSVKLVYRYFYLGGNATHFAKVSCLVPKYYLWFFMGSCISFSMYFIMIFHCNRWYWIPAALNVFHYTIVVSNSGTRIETLLTMHNWWLWISTQQLIEETAEIRNHNSCFIHPWMGQYLYLWDLSTALCWCVCCLTFQVRYLCSNMVPILVAWLLSPKL
jgi:hypothetical protein